MTPRDGTNAPAIRSTPKRVKLTKRAIDAARYTGKVSGRKAARCVLWDTLVPGFGVRLFPSGRKVFVIQYRPEGSRMVRMMALDAFGVVTLDQARRRARRELAAISEGRDPLEERAKKRAASRRKSVETVADLSAKWIEEYAKPRRRSWKGDERRIEKHLRPGSFGKRPYEKLTAQDVRALHAAIGSRAPVEANRVAELLRAIFNWAIEEGYLPRGHPNPALITRRVGATSRVKRFKEKSRDRWLAGKELLRLAAAINRENDPWVQAAFRLLLLTGCRKTELLRARWDRLDKEGKRLLLEDTKTGEAKSCRCQHQHSRRLAGFHGHCRRGRAHRGSSRTGAIRRNP